MYVFIAETMHALSWTLIQTTLMVYVPIWERRWLGSVASYMMTKQRSLKKRKVIMTLSLLN